MFPNHRILKSYLTKMAFHLTSRYVNVNDKLLLSAICRRCDGYTWSPTTVELNKVLGNDDGNLSSLAHCIKSTLTQLSLGKFVWNSEGFGADAKDVRLIDHRVLSARLKRKDGSWTEKPVTINLAERIENLNGTLFCHTQKPRR